MERIKGRNSFALDNKLSSKEVRPLVKCNETITLDTSSEVIENSIVETTSEFDWIKTPRSLRSRSKIIRNPGPCINRVPSPVRQRNSHENRGGADVWSPAACIKAVKKGESPILEFLEHSRKSLRRRSSTPVHSLLHGSKQRNVESWLAVASAQTCTTPPMSLSPPAQKETNRQSFNTPSELDPEVKNVLLAVYGADWQSKAFKKCKTDIKKTQTKPKLGPTTDGKCTRKLKFDPVPTEENVNGKKTSRSRDVRRKIFDNDSPLSMRSRSVSRSSTQRSQPVPSSASTVRKKKTARKRKISTSSEDSNVKPLEPLTPVVTPFRTPKSQKIKEMTDVGSNTKTPRRTFLASLSVSTPTSIGHPEAKAYKVSFAKKKDELCAKLLKLYNAEVFDSKLPSDMSITWNSKMRGTAGYCYSKRKKNNDGVLVRVARVELSPRVVDRADRLRDTLLHELCHAAAWIVDGILDGHGPVWQAWASRAMKRFPELPAIKRCHNYQIATKYTYRCTVCGYSINRQSRSIDTDRKRCGHCYGVLELLFNRKKQGASEAPEFETTRTLRAPNSFALFVKENYKTIKDANPDKKHAEIMKLISERYSVFKSVVTPKGLKQKK